MQRIVQCLAAVLLLGAMAVSAPEKGKRAVEPELNKEMPEGGPHHQLMMEERKMELEFKRQMQQLELEKKRLALQQQRQRLGKSKSPWHGRAGKKGGVVLVWCLVIHVLLTVWVFQDTRKREGVSGLWVAVTLLAGVFGALVYAVVRLGDVGQKKG